MQLMKVRQKVKSRMTRMHDLFDQNHHKRDGDGRVQQLAGAIQVGQKPGWTRSPHNLMLISSDSLKNLIWSLFCNAGRDPLMFSRLHHTETRFLFLRESAARRGRRLLVKA